MDTEVRGVPFQRTEEPVVKPLPKTDNVTPLEPTTIWVADREVITGVAVGAERVSVADATLPPGFGLVTRTVKFPAVA
jgi:hypothetical protein